VWPGYIFLGSHVPGVRQRSFTHEDADVALVGDGTTVSILGYLNDASRKYPMIGKRDITLHAFSSGPNGPDKAYDAYYWGTLDPGLIENAWCRVSDAVGDVNGDGWDDVLFGDAEYPDRVFEDGVALILTGGAYIPRDSLPPSAIDDIGGSAETARYTLWPIPASSTLHVAWRGDLPAMPRRYAVHDLLGRVVASGTIAFGASELTCDVSQRAAGACFLVLFDASGSVLVSRRIAVVH
jgi:hypothetical protein